MAGTLQCTEDIANKYININVDQNINVKYISSLQCNNNGTNQEEEEDEDEDVGADSENNSNIRRSRRNQNHKKAKKYCAPSEELTRLQIREDIRKMRNPKMHEIKLIVQKLGAGFESYIDHKVYSFDAGTTAAATDVYLDDAGEDDDDDDDGNEDNFDDIEFIEMHSKHKKKKKKKRKRHYDYQQNGVNAVKYPSSSPNSAFRISASNNILNDHQAMNGNEPLRKKQKVVNNNNNHNHNSTEAIKCGKCNKLFTLEVDLLLHKTNEHC